MNKIMGIYRKLETAFGPQYWWPVTKENELFPEYYKKTKNNEKQKLEIIFGAILTQYSRVS